MRVILYFIAVLSILFWTNVSTVFAQVPGSPSVLCEDDGFEKNAGFDGKGGFRGGGNHPTLDDEGQKKSDPLMKARLAPDDPMVNEAEPPPPSAKLITKVGWCEVQVFGHTFSFSGLREASLPVSYMHLTDRLEQLNSKLKYAPGKSGIQLMDKIDTLVKYIYAHKDSLPKDKDN
jgi:hypothetical protein